jgi:Fic family protein
MSPFKPQLPYNDLPRLPPKESLETAEVLKAALAAGRALAELKGMVRVLPNPAILLNNLVLLEAQASSEVENIFTTQDQLYRAEGPGQEAASDSATKEVLHYRQALWHGTRALREGKKFTPELLRKLTSIIKEQEMPFRADSGTVIATRAGQVLYTPPEGEARIRGLIANLIQYMHDDGDGLDPLLKMAVLHYQFEAIHPFHDGNGRTGRILCILYLLHAGLLDEPILFLSRYINDARHKAMYYQCLYQVNAGRAWGPWLAFMMEAVSQTAGQTRVKVEGIRRLLEQTLEQARAKLPKRTYSKELIEATFSNPYCRIGVLQARGLGHRHTCARYLHDLAQAGLLTLKKKGRDKLYINQPLMRLLAAP